jgi:pyruvate dehydrogenase E1 component
MLPFYIYYSIFGFQRVGDAIWAAADQRARGFLLGATSGRTTLGGEGLQHQDGSSHLVAATIPNCKAYDPAFAGELAVIIDAGMREMLTDQRDVFYYITLMNENYAQTNLLPGKEKDILAGGYHYQKASPNAKQRVTLLGSGAILLEVTKAAELLKQVGIDADIFSITSWSELARNGQQKLLAAFADGNKGIDIEDDVGSEGQAAFITSLLANSAGPIIAATDYVRAVPESIRAYIPNERNYFTLGTDGFGRSDTRAALREFFQVDAASIAKAAQFCLHSNTKLNSSTGFQ